jgi:hypothetical protein
MLIYTLPKIDDVSSASGLWSLSETAGYVHLSAGEIWLIGLDLSRNKQLFPKEIPLWKSTADCNGWLRLVSCLGGCLAPRFD